jgi:hypothetical protein
MAASPMAAPPTEEPGRTGFFPTTQSPHPAAPTTTMEDRDGQTTFSRGQRVRLLEEAHGVAAGAEGTIVGFYARDALTIVVRFDDAAVEVAPTALAPAESDP